MSKLILPEQKILIDNAWLNLDKSTLLDPNLFNPLAKKTREDLESPHHRILRLMMNPDYFGFTCKYLLNKELHPFQLAILKELWIRPFPMFVGARGCGKTTLLAIYAMLRATLNQGSKIVVVGAAFRQSKYVFEYCEDIWRNAPILRDMCGKDKAFGTQGPRRDVDRCTLRIGDSIIVALPIGDGCVTSDCMITLGDQFSNINESHNLSKTERCIIKRDQTVWSKKGFVESDESYCNGVAKTKKVTTKKGFSIEGTLNHKLKVLRNKAIVWCRLDEMQIGDFILMDRSRRWHGGNENISIDEAYALGLMIGDGCWTSKYALGYSSNDEQLIQAVEVGLGHTFTSYKNDPYHFRILGQDNVKKFLKRWEMPVSYAKDKILPPPILRASRDIMSACISGIFDTDGTLQVSTIKGGTHIQISLTNTSEKLIDQIQYILLHYGIISTKSYRDRNEKWNRIYELHISGQNVKIFAEEIGFRLKRKQDKLLAGLNDKIRDRTTTDGVPHVKEEMARIAAENKIKRGQSKYKHLGTKNILAKKTITRDYINKFIEQYSFVNDQFIGKLRELANPNIYYDEVISIEDGEATTYDIHVPETHEYCANGFFSHNTKIRGQRATHIIADEFASINVDIYETVISGFAAVSSNPMEKVKHGARIEAMKNLGLLTKEQADTSLKSVTSNQSIVSGSADYGFKHFCDYWKRWKGIIESKGDTQKLQEVFNGKIPENFNWKDYSIIRMPSKLLPNLFMDKNTLSKAKATMHISNYLMEYEAVFAMDSDGFFKRSLIESCVVGSPKTPIMGKLGEISFSAMLRGMPGRKYIMAVDPASESDNFAIIILECWDDHRRIVYCWTTTRAKYKERLKAGKAEEQEFYGYCARKIRDLLALFKPCERIVLDAQGGGIAIMEALHDPVRLKDGEIPIWEIVDNKKLKDTDNKVGAHILEMVQFADSSWVSAANHGMKKDFEDKTLLFPPLDSVALGLAMEDDKLMGREDSPYDLLEDCMFEIEELKNELATIVHTQTGISLRDRWSTPEIKQPGGKKGRLRKDRYSALLMANMSARTLSRQFVPEYQGFLGGIVQDVAKQKVLANMPVIHQNPDWYINAVEAMSNLGAVVTRR